MILSSEYISALCTIGVWKYVILHFANRPRMPFLPTDLYFGARKPLLKRFVWHFDKLIDWFYYLVKSRWTALFGQSILCTSSSRVSPVLCGICPRSLLNRISSTPDAVGSWSCFTTTSIYIVYLNPPSESGKVCFFFNHLHLYLYLPLHPRVRWTNVRYTNIFPG